MLKHCEGYRHIVQTTGVSKLINNYYKLDRIVTCLDLDPASTGGDKNALDHDTAPSVQVYQQACLHYLELSLYQHIYIIVYK